MKEIIKSLIVIGAVLTALGAGTLAWFSDTETSSGNTFTAGTLDLKIKDGDESWKDGVTASITMSNMKPSDFTNGMIGFKNVGTIAGDHLEIAVSYTISEIEIESGVLGTSADEMADYLILDEMTYYYDTTSTDLLTLLTDNDGDGIDLLELKTQGVDNLPPPTGVGGERLDLTIRFHETAGNEFQGDELNVTFTFTLNQDSSQ